MAIRWPAPQRGYFSAELTRRGETEAKIVLLQRRAQELTVDPLSVARHNSHQTGPECSSLRLASDHWTFLTNAACRTCSSKQSVQSQASCHKRPRRWLVSIRSRLRCTGTPACFPLASAETQRCTLYLKQKATREDFSTHVRLELTESPTTVGTLFRRQQDEDKFVRYLTRDKLLTVDARDTDGTTLLMAATKGGRLHLVRKILDMRCTLLNVADKDGNTALDYACAVGKEQVIEYMTVGHVKHSNTRVPFLKALLPAILRGDVESVQQSVLPCIEYQIYIDRHMEDVVGLSWTPCGKAELLVNKVSEGLVYTWNSKNPDAQVRAGDRIVKVNDAEGDYHALQFELGKYQEATIVLHRHLLDEGLDPNAKDDRGSPLLHHAVKTGNPKLVEALMAGDNVEINQTDKLGRTALDVAEDYKKQASEDAQSGWDEVIGLLKKSNAKRSSA